MRLSICALGLAAGMATLVPANSASADVNLLLSKMGSSTTTSLSVPAGGAFDLSVYLQTIPVGQGSAPQVTGVDYFLGSKLSGSNVSGIFTLSTQTFPSTFNSPTGNAFSSQVLSPISQDIGSGLTDTFNGTPLSGGPIDIADYHVLVSPSAAVGTTYTIGIVNNATSQLGYAGPAPSFDSGTFTNVGSVAVTVTPEPALLSVFAGIGSALMLRRRRSVTL